MTNAPDKRVRVDTLTKHIESTARMEKLEGWLAQGITPRKASSLAREEFGISLRHANRYVRLAFARWAAESQRGRPEKRAQMRAALWDGYRQCLEIQGMALDGMGEEHHYESPDMKAAAKFLEMLCRLDGLMEQDVIGSGDIQEHLIVLIQQSYKRQGAPGAIDAHGETVGKLEAGDESRRID